MDNTYYITTAIEYVNGKPHVGHAYEKIGADILARVMRMRGRDVVFQMGTDEHSTNVARIAEEKGISPQAYCDSMVERFVEAWEKLNLSYDVFIRTSEERHHLTVQRLLTRIHEKGDIFVGKYKGYYCPSCERYYQEKDLVKKGNQFYCKIHDIPAEWIEEENYFFKLSKYQEPLLKHIEETPDFILPERRRNEIVNVIKDGLDDLSISRSGVTWGVPLPFDESAMTYVWFDALINYLSAIEFGVDDERYRRYWPAQVQVIGKDITRFHCIYWPAMLLSADIPLPKTIFGHGFVHLGGEKMSKTKGTAVNPLDIIDTHGADSLRYYLAKEISWGNDGDFTMERFKDIYNADLANNLGNMVNRSITMARRFSEDGVVRPADVQADVFPETMKDEFLEAIDSHRIHDACRTVIKMVDAVNLYIDQKQPWVLAKDEANRNELIPVLYNLVEATRWIAAFIFPVMPDSAEKIWQQLGLSGSASDTNLDEIVWGEFPDKHELKKPKPIFPRIED